MLSLLVSVGVDATSIHVILVAVWKLFDAPCIYVLRFLVLAVSYICIIWNHIF
jgi:hypothetical protein